MHILSYKSVYDKKLFVNSMSHQLLSVDIPFFFNNYEGLFYRFEASVYNFLKGSLLHNQVLELSLNFKSNFKVFKPVFFQPTGGLVLNKVVKPSFFYSYLLGNSFLNKGFNSFFYTGSCFAESIANEKRNDYFFFDRYNNILDSLCFSTGTLTDHCIELYLVTSRLNNYVRHASFSVELLFLLIVVYLLILILVYIQVLFLT